MFDGLAKNVFFSSFFFVWSGGGVNPMSGGYGVTLCQVGANIMLPLKLPFLNKP